MKGTVRDVKEKLIVFGIITGIFLPLRMIFYTYLSAHWIGSLGLTSLFMFVLIFLAQKRKMGFFGELFLRQLTKTVKGKSGKIAIVFSLVLVAYFGGTLVLVERGNTVYLEEKHIVSQLLSSDSQHQLKPNDVSTIMRIHQTDSFLDGSHITYADQIMSTTYAIMNDMTGGWLVNLDIILLVEQFEFLGFLLIYGKMCVPQKSHDTMTLSSQ